MEKNTPPVETINRKTTEKCARVNSCMGAVQRQKQEARTPRDKGSKDGSVAAATQEMPKTAKKPPGVQKTGGSVFPYRFQKQRPDYTLSSDFC